MKKHYLFLFIILISFKSWSQTIIKGNEPTYVSSGMGIHYNSIVPLGFSPDGNFAYLEYYNGDAIAFWALKIKSIITDDILYYQDWNGDEGYLYDSEDFNDLLSNESEFLTSIYFTYNIDKNTDLTLSRFPYDSNEDSYDVDLLLEVLPTGEYLEAMGLKESKVQIKVSNNNGSKIIGVYEQHMKSSVIGCIKSPFEERIVVLILKGNLGFEGSTEHSFGIYGCSLEYGFK